jgi:hypothetical protein
VGPAEAQDQDQNVEVVMAELEFSRREVEDLAGKLDSQGSQLSRRERLLLLAIFSAASNEVRRSGAETPGQTEATLANLREELVNAFIPGDDPHFIINAIGIHPDQ